MRRWCLVAALIFILLMSAYVMADEMSENLIQNGGFETIDENGLPAFWEMEVYAEADTLFLVSSASHSGENAAMIRSGDMNDARFSQTVAVDPESLYCLSGYIKTGRIPDAGSGANISVSGVYYHLDGLFDTNGQWHYFVDYGETGIDQTSVTVYARLGGYGGESKGEAAFDDIQLVKVASLPDDIVAKIWYPVENSREYTGTAYNEPDVYQAPAGSFYPWLIGMAALFLLMVLYHARRTGDDFNLVKPRFEKSPYIVFFTGLLISFSVRLFIGYTVTGYDVDISCFLSWGGSMVRHGPGAFYQNVSFCDYVPGYLYVLWLKGALFTSDYSLNLLIIKTVPIICDALGAYLIFREGKKELNHKAASALGLLYAFNPAIALTSAAWGQIDSVYTFFLLLTVIYTVKRKWRLAIPLYVLSVLIKPQALLFGPLGLAALFVDINATKTDVKKLVTGLVIGLYMALLVIVPFNGTQELGWIFGKYAETLSSYPHTTINTANFFYLFDNNWGSLTRTVPMPMTLSAIITGLTLIFFKLRKRQDWNAYKLGGAALFLAASAAAFIFRDIWTFEVFGYMIILLAVSYSIFCFVKGGQLKHLPLIGGVMLLLLFAFGIRMHERYIFPALILLTLAYVKNKDWRILLIMALISGVMLINCGIILDNSIRFGRNMGHLNADTQIVNQAISLINVGTALFALFVMRDLTVKASEPKTLTCRNYNGKRPRESFQHAQEALLRPSDTRLHMTLRDYLIMLGVTALYAVLALVNLGSVKAPQTYYASKNAEDEIIFDLGEETSFSMLYYAQVSYDKFEVRVSPDGFQWSEEYLANMSQGDCFRWKYLTSWFLNWKDQVEYNNGDIIWLEGRFVKITPKQTDLVLCEVIFRGLDGNRITASAVTDSALLLLDEQDTLTGEPGWYNGTYFDEIYHARTAYEHAHAFDEDAVEKGVFPYETTHPPLGKVIMSWSVMIFGMTPFGWRFAGALTGILMLPVMYLLGKRLFGKTRYAAAAMLLMALDTMHFTQTRIATIDSFAVFFIMLAYYFMLRFMKADVWGKGFAKSMIPLFFSGLFMGLSIASKWIGFYAAIGLAVLFFYTVGRHIMQWRAAKTMDAVTGDRMKAVARARYFGLTDTLGRCLACIVFFIVIPLIVYYVSYIPYFNTTGGVTIEKVVEAAIGRDYGSGIRSGGMLGYHATPNLGMDHPFYSPWHEWPLILKPMYYASANYMPEGYSYSLFLTGNPAVWWGGLAALFITVGIWINRHFLNTAGGIRFSIRAYDGQITWGYVLIGFLSQYLPWVLVPRGTYIYHYFASLPFIMLATVGVFCLAGRKFGKKADIALYIFLGLAAGCFIILYPYASGITVPVSWLDFARNLMIKRNIYY